MNRRSDEGHHSRRARDTLSPAAPWWSLKELTALIRTVRRADALIAEKAVHDGEGELCKPKAECNSCTAVRKAAKQVRAAIESQDHPQRRKRA